MISIVICDDDRLFAERLSASIESAMSRRGIKAKVYEFSGAEEIGSEVLAACDIAFLDIDFKGRNYTGLDIARRLRGLREDAVITFVTNYIEYAPEGYEVRAFRYILKNELPQKLDATIDQIVAHLQTDRSSIKIQADGEVLDLPVQDILYIESMRHTLNVHVQAAGRAAEKTYSCRSTLAKMEADLSRLGFLRIHKSYLVNMHHIKSLNCSEAVLKSGISLKVGSTNYSECKKRYMLWRGSQ